MTPFDLVTLAPTGSKLVAALLLPTGLSTDADTTVTGGTVTGTTTVPTSATLIYAGMAESPAGSGVYRVEADVEGTLLPDTAERPYKVEARVVAGATDMTSYAAVAAAYAASADVAYTGDIPATLMSGMLRSGVWLYQADARAMAGVPLTPNAGYNFGEFFHAAGNNPASDVVIDGNRILDVLQRLQGVSSLANWLRILGRADNADPTAVTEMNANNGVGTGTFDPATDSQEAIRNRGDAAWTGGGGGGGGVNRETRIIERNTRHRLR